MKSSIVSLLAISLIISIGAGCSKKITKVQQSPPETQSAEEINPPQSDTSFFREQEMDPRMKEALVPIYFDYDKYTLRRTELAKLEKIANLLQENSRVRVLIEGHCDERGSSEYNMGLGQKRAHTVQQWLAAYGIQESRIEVTSYGKERLSLTGCQDDGCHSQNRRDEWKVLNK
jgi:peptidoglycan-associated lipoprotein